jgi:hypothetical protein
MFRQVRVKIFDAQILKKQNNNKEAKRDSSA